MDKCVAWSAVFTLARETFVLVGEKISEFHKRASEIILIVGFVNAMVQVNLDLAKAIGLQLRHPVKYLSMILLRRIKVRMAKGRTVAIAHRIPNRIRVARPFIEAPQLRIHIHRNSVSAFTIRLFVVGRLEVVRHDENQMMGADVLDDALPDRPGT